MYINKKLGSDYGIHARKGHIQDIINERKRMRDKSLVIAKYFRPH